jgi:hypothetical protein
MNILKNIKHKDVEEMSYSEWKSTLARLEELGAIYKREFEPIYQQPSIPASLSFNRETEETERYLMREISYLEYILGY